MKTPPAPPPSEEGGQEPQEASGGKKSKAGTEEVPDWLTRIRAKSQMEQETNNLTQSVLPKDESDAGETGSSATAPDWLKELRNEKESAPDEADQDAIWAGTAAIYTPTDIPEASTKAKPPTDEESDEFLKHLAEWKPKETIKLEDDLSLSQAESPAVPPESVPEKPFSEPVTPAEEGKVGGTDLPDWLRKIAQFGETPSAASAPVEPGQPEGQAVAPAPETPGTPDWLNRVVPPAENEAAAVESPTLDWLNEPAKSEEETSSATPAAAEPARSSEFEKPAESISEKPEETARSASEETPTSPTASVIHPPQGTAPLPAEESSATAPATPDWLGALKQQFAEAEQPEVTAAPSMEEPSETSAPSVPAPEVAGHAAVPDWLNEIRQPLENEPAAPEVELSPEPTGEATPFAAAPTEPTAEEEDNRLQAVIQPSAVEPVEPLPMPEIPPSNRPVETPPESSMAPSAETIAPPKKSELVGGEESPITTSTPDSGQETGPESPLGGEPAIADGVLPDWLKDLARPSEEELTAAEGLSEAAQEKEEAEVSAFFESTPADTMPVREVLAAQRRAEEEAAQSPTPAEETEGRTPETVEESAPAAAPVEEIKSIEPPAEVKEPPSTQIKETPFSSELLEQTPAWLRELESMPTAEATPPQPSAQPAATIPAFQFEPEESEEPLPAEPPTTAYEAEFNETPVEGVLPDWLEELKPDTGTPPPPEAPAAAAFIEENEETAPAPGMPEMEKSKPFSLGGELPDWLSTHWQAEEGEGGSNEAKLAMANLPGWVQALRPLDALNLNRFSSDVDSRIENKGPLAGFAGVLPGDTAPLNYPRPPLYSTKLHVSERQKMQATLLEQMVKETPAAEEETSRSKAIAQRLYRMVTGLVLIGILVYSLFFGFKLLPLSSLAPAPVVAVHDAIAQLPPDSAVLVAVDYEAGLSGEVKQVALPVVEQMMAQSDYLVLLSTSVNGQALGDDLVRSANTEVSSYNVAQNVVNLGYLPGGTTGLQSFAHDPAETVPNTWQMTKAWLHVNLQSAGQIDQFAAVVVLTDSPETARAWIEQVQPTLNGKPLFMVVSAQAAPLVQPYVAAGQVSGMVAGLEDAAVYEQLTQRSGNAMAFLGAYQTGLIVMAALILVGGVLQLLTSLFKNRKTEKGA
ncbi:MAG: hypothetical protein ABSA51_07800 [Anaerolineaceae bacterium]